MSKQDPGHVKAGLKHLGRKYTTKVIDHELCIYRRIGNYDFEITHVKENWGDGKGYRVFVWDISNGVRIVEHMPGYVGLKELKPWLDDAVKRYTDLQSDQTK